MSERGYDALIVDLDGCVWVGDDATPGVADALARWRASGRELAFVTNEPRYTPEHQVQRLWALGIRASAHEMVTVGMALQAHLAVNHSGDDAFVIGSESLIRHVRAAGLRSTNNIPARAAASSVVVIAAHDAFGYAELRVAVRAGLNGAALYATGRDRTFPTPDGQWPGTGAVVAAIEYAVGRPVRALGKPERNMFDRAGAGFSGSRVLAVGDRLESDVRGAANAGLDAALVLSGVTDAAALDAWDGPRPVLVAPTLADTIDRLLDGRPADPVGGT
ncbi:MAG: HAD-IIA family hydrolase [Actinobacteria bacterium]|nr:HAD-IIA family hydrolase [Actinomycetota bacterium]